MRSAVCLPSYTSRTVSKNQHCIRPHSRSAQSLQTSSECLCSCVPCISASKQVQSTRKKQSQSTGVQQLNISFLPSKICETLSFLQQTSERNAVLPYLEALHIISTSLLLLLIHLLLIHLLLGLLLISLLITEIRL